MRPRKKKGIPVTDHPRKTGGSCCAERRNRNSPVQLTILMDSSDAQQGVIIAAFHPADQRRPVFQHHQIDAAYGITVIDTNRGRKGHPFIVGQNHLDACAVLSGCKPGCSNPFAVSREGGAVDRATIDFPAILIQRVGRRPMTIVPPHHGNIPNISFRSISIGHESAAGCFDG